MSTPQRIERLVLLMDLLLDTRRSLSAQEIRAEIRGYPDNDASFKRQFERDKDELREMGVPLIVEEVPGADPPVLGYRIRKDDYELRDPGLEVDELEALNLAAAVVGFSGGLGRRAMFKLGGGASPVAQRAELADDPNLFTAFAAVVARQPVAFRYHEVDRVVDPHRLQFARGRWYLHGLDHHRGDRRWYRMGRIQGTVQLNGERGAFEAPQQGGSDLRLDPWALSSDAQPVVARVWFDPVAAVGVRDDLRDAVVVSDDDRGMVVELVVHNRDGFRSWVLSYLDRAEVLGPADLRAEMISWLEGLARGGGR